MNPLLRRPLIMFAVVFVASALIQAFQISLEQIIDWHQQFPSLVFALPVAWIFFWLTIQPKAWNEFETTDQILREVHTPERRINPWLMPLIWIRTLWSHLFGASVGREGTALQMAGSLADFGAGRIGLSANDRQALLRVALAAGLASAYQTPWAGFIFALELGGTLDHRTRIESLLGSWLSYFVAIFFFHHKPLDPPQIDFDWATLLDLRILGLILGLVLFAPVYKAVFLVFNRFVRHRPYWLRWLLGGIGGLALFWIWADVPLQNLGTGLIDQAFSENLPGWIFLKKAVVTAWFCAMGWFGGDFTPNMAAGATAGNAIAVWVGFPLPILGAAFGLFLPIAFTHRILATGWVMTLEYFGWEVALAALPVFILAWGLEKICDRWVFPRLRQ